MASSVSTVPRGRDRISPALTWAVSGAPPARVTRMVPEASQTQIVSRSTIDMVSRVPTVHEQSHTVTRSSSSNAFAPSRGNAGGSVACRGAQPGGAVSLQLDEHRAQRRVGRALLDVRGASPGRGQCPDCGHRRSFRAIKACDDASARLVVRAHLIVDVSMQGRRLPLGPDDVPDRNAVGLDELRRVGSRKGRRVLLRGQTCRQAGEHDRCEVQVSGTS